MLAILKVVKLKSSRVFVNSTLKLVKVYLKQK